ncbi:hypothetical protein [Streptomyces canus]|uniref:hypothetical protein n=1 Tax=Streptomyces canus TaxID=58343 RepID=UPI000AED0FFA|nr:hypothetical protein [Streptomyces canus]
MARFNITTAGSPDDRRRAGGTTHSRTPSGRTADHFSPTIHHSRTDLTTALTSA